MSGLKLEVANFRRWASESGKHPGCSAEWECDYPNWLELYTAVEKFLESATNRLLASDELDLLIYSLARDNEDEHILELLERFPKTAMQLAQAGLNYSDINARWQIAVLLGRIKTPESIELLQQYISDEAEYVRRRAGFALEGK